MNVLLLVVLLLTTVAVPPAPGQTNYDLLFIHHSVGYQWLVSGGLYMGLIDANQVGGRRLNVHYATYGDEIGDYTDMCHWRRKFRDRMDKVLSFDLHPNIYYQTKGRFNQVVMFKSCFPNSIIPAIGTPPGDPDSATATLCNYMAAFEELALLFDDHPQVLFLHVTSPPRNVLDNWTRNGSTQYRYFISWLKDTWLPAYRASTGLDNVEVFDFFDVLAEADTHPTAPNSLKTIYAKGNDSHPTTAGLNAATGVFLPFITQALDRWERRTYQGCGPASKPAPWIHEVGRSALYNLAYRVRVANAAPGSPGTILGSTQRQTLPLGLSGCQILAAPVMGIAVKASVTTGEISLPLPIPPAPSLIGSDLYLQAVILNPQGGFGGMADLSNLLRVRILAR